MLAARASNKAASLARVGTSIRHTSRPLLASSFPSTTSPCSSLPAHHTPHDEKRHTQHHPHHGAGWIRRQYFSSSSFMRASRSQLYSMGEVRLPFPYPPFLFLSPFPPNHRAHLNPFAERKNVKPSPFPFACISNWRLGNLPALSSYGIAANTKLTPPAQFLPLTQPLPPPSQKTGLPRLPGPRRLPVQAPTHAPRLPGPLSNPRLCLGLGALGRANHLRTTLPLRPPPRRTQGPLPPTHVADLRHPRPDQPGHETRVRQPGC